MPLLRRLAAAALVWSSAISAQQPASLETLADQAVQAILAGDGTRLPLAEGFRHTQNGVTLEIGDGIWRTLSAYAGLDSAVAPAAAPLAYRFNLVDRETGEVLAWRATDESGTPGVLVLRLEVEGGTISEMETVSIREEKLDARGGTVTLVQPRLLQMLDPAGLGAIDPAFAARASADRAALVAAAGAYLDGAVAGSSAGVPLASGCVRRDNGHVSTGDAASPPLDAAAPGYRPWALGCGEQLDSGLYRYIGQIRDRRFLVDPERGLVAVIAVADVPGTLHSLDIRGVGAAAYPGPATERALDLAKPVNQLEEANLRVPSSMLSIYLFKLQGGTILRVEAFHRGGHLGLKSGW